VSPATLLRRIILVIALLTLPHALRAASFEADVRTMTPLPCSNGEAGCFRVELDGGERTLTLDIGPQDYLGGREPGFARGNRVVVQEETIEEMEHAFISDVVRRPALGWLLLLFLVAVVACGGRGALRSLGGMACSFLLLFGALLPAILRGWPPLPVALGGGMAIMLATLLLSHGIKPKTWCALAGTATSLLVTGVLAVVFARLAAMTGMDEDTLFLLSDYPNLDTRGILLAGIIIGTLGVLDDVTISQASAVFELRAANPLLSAQQLYRRALRIGRDHIAAAVNTLVLAYAGSALPLLLLLTGVPAGESWWIMLNREMIAIEILRTLVGSIGLLSAVPITTWIAAKTAVKMPPIHDDHSHLHS
jgi:uncharacterized membrane protein